MAQCICFVRLFFFVLVSNLISMGLFEHERTRALRAQRFKINEKKEEILIDGTRNCLWIERNEKMKMRLLCAFVMKSGPCTLAAATLITIQTQIITYNQSSHLSLWLPCSVLFVAGAGKRCQKLEWDFLYGPKTESKQQHRIKRRKANSE